MLRERAVDADRRAAERLAAWQRAQRPSDVLARHARPLVLAIELVQAFEMLEEHRANLRRRRGRRRLAGRQEMVELAEQPRPSLGGAADHDAVGAGGF